MRLCMHLLAAPAGERDHHSLHIRLQGAVVSGRMPISQDVFGHRRIALIDAIRRPAVAYEVLGGRDDMAIIELVQCARRALQASNHRLPERPNDRWVLTEGFVASSPAGIVDDGKCGSEGPGDTGRAHITRYGLADLLDQIRIARGAQRDIVRIEHRAEQIIVPVHGVRSPDNGDGRRACLGRHGGVVISVGQRQPIGRCRVKIALWRGSAAVEHGPEMIGPDVCRRD